MSSYEFASGNPWLTFFLAALILQAALVLVSRLIRIAIVSKNGWPPEHLDADGDPISSNEEGK
jgi:hypothetical protein